MIKIRLRLDGIGDADDAARRLRGETVDWCACGDPECHAVAKATPPAAPGDTWRLTFYDSDNTAGYAICCPKCLRIHHWCNASNCGEKHPYDWTDRDGTKRTGWTCGHQDRRESCWTWTGSASDGTLTCVPSLLECGDCKWHGWVTNGELRGC